MTQRVVNYTYGTGNPVLPDGSIDVRDGIDNLQSMDVFMNAPEDTYNQRDGGVVKTVHGMINEFNQQLDQQESEFNQHISGMAFARVGTFKSGATLDDLREVLLWDVSDGGDGHEYGWTGPFPKTVAPNSTPSSTGGVGAGAWVDRTDATLRSELAAQEGAELVGYSFNGTAYGGRNVLKKLRDAVVNIEDFGAAGDGVTDDTAAFVAANVALPHHSYLALQAGKNYLISGVVFTKNISLGCPSGQSTITSNTGCKWLVDYEYLNVTVENLIFMPRLIPNRSNPTTAINIELVNKNYGGSGYSRVINTRVRRNGALAYYNGIRMKNCPSIIDRCDISLASSTSALAYAGDADAWAENSGDGVLLDSTTYSFVHETKSYYGQNGFRVTGQIEDSHFVGCMALVNRVCYLYEDLILPSNEHRVTRSHGVAYFKGIDIATDGNAGRIGFCSVSECSIMVPPECTVAGVIYLGGLFDGANISAFQAYRSSSRGSSDKAIYLPTSGSFGSRRTVINGLHCYGVKTGVYINTAERVNITNVNMLQFNMVGASTSVYEYGPNATGIVSSAYGFPDAENIFTGRLSCGVISATTSIGLKTANTVTAGGVDKFRIIDAAGNFRFESADSAGVLQYNAGIDQGGSFRTKSIYPLVDNASFLGSSPLRWKAVFATTSTINTSDEHAKTSISSINEAVLDAWQDVDWNNQFRFKSSLIAKGADGARWHFGLIAQRVEAVFASHGIDGFTLGLLCFDEWGAQDEIIETVPAVLDEEGRVIEPERTVITQQAREAGSLYGIRYEEALALEAALQRRNYQRLEKRIEELESK